jgi:AraC family transcriptional regulator of adaptative response/methylated-DNA-[protein]-cysteine methyltransferase
MLVGDLHTRFARQRLINCDRELQPLLKDVAGLIDCPSRGTTEPLDMRGTEFQRRVWASVLKIPPGRTASYGDVARSAGAPKAVRAVAQACSANPIAVAIPCHRVVRDDGTLSGYRWGIERKRALLARETAA